MYHYKTQKGIVLVICMIFLCIFSALAISMASMAGTNVQLAENQRKADNARASAESGLEIVRLWLNSVSIPGTTSPSDRFNLIASSFQSATAGISNVTTNYNGSSITIPNVMLDQISGQGFSAVITQTQIDPGILQVNVTGKYGPITRTIRANYIFGTRANNVFDFGVATKGPLSLAGNIELEGVNVSVESDVYIESLSELLALSIIGNSQIAGDVKIVNPLANAYLQGGKAGIGGETGEAAIDNHVSTGVPPTEFPEPNPGHFQGYVQNIIDMNNTTFENVRVPAATNPTFAAGVTLKGIVFVETPNIITFAGHADITGILVGNGSVEDNSGANQINFQGTVDSWPVTALPDEPKFAGVKNETGTFLIAPGFNVSFGGNFGILNGVIAANGVGFHGNAGGTVLGSIINYSDNEMTLTGNSDLYFNRSGTAKVPAGFVPEIVLKYDPTSYSEDPLL